MAQETKTCPTHKLELRFMPEGISRKGTRYNAFWACPNRDCKHTENIEEKQGHFLSMQAEFRRAKEIAYGGSSNRAIEIGAKTEDEFEKWFIFFMKHWESWYADNIMNEK